MLDGFDFWKCAIGFWLSVFHAFSLCFSFSFSFFLTISLSLSLSLFLCLSSFSFLFRSFWSFLVYFAIFRSFSLVSLGFTRFCSISLCFALFLYFSLLFFLPLSYTLFHTLPSNLLPPSAYPCTHVLFLSSIHTFECICVFSGIKLSQFCSCKTSLAKRHAINTCIEEN